MGLLIKMANSPTRHSSRWEWVFEVSHSDVIVGRMNFLPNGAFNQQLQRIHSRHPPPAYLFLLLLHGKLKREMIDRFWWLS